MCRRILVFSDREQPDSLFVDQLCVIPQRTLDLFPDDANELDAIPHLFSQRNRVGTEVLRLS